MTNPIVRSICRSDKSEGFTEDTLFKVLDALVACDLTHEEAVNCIREMQNAGILFRERFELPVIWNKETEDVHPRVRDNNSE